MAAALSLAATLAACASDSANAHRLHVLQHDPVLRCRPVGVTQAGALDSAGSRNGIGFGGVSPTDLVRNFRLTGDANRVAAELSACATHAGWAVAADPVSKPSFLVLRGHKQFEDRWNASLEIFIGNDSQHRPSVQLEIDTEPV
jgi:hypothetical protein